MCFSKGTDPPDNLGLVSPPPSPATPRPAAETTLDGTQIRKEEGRQSLLADPTTLHGEYTTDSTTKPSEQMNSAKVQDSKSTYRSAAALD